MGRTYIYARVSHRDSVESGVSIPTQVESAERYREIMGLPALGNEPYCDEAVSGWSKALKSRPAGGRLWNILRRGDHVIMTRMDRGFRSVKDFAETASRWIDSGINVHFCDQRFNLTSANGKLLAHILAAFAQWKSDMISERTKLGLAKAAKREKKRAVSRDHKDIQFDNGLPRVSGYMVEDAPTEMGGKVYGYSRVSTFSQVQGSSLESQREILSRYTRWLTEGNSTLEYGGEYCDEGVSAFKKNLRDRPAGRRLDKVLGPGDHIVFSRLDRAWRNLRDMSECWAEWNQRGVTVHFADIQTDTSSPMGKLLVQVLSALAEWESRDIGERRSGAIKHMKSMGLKHSKDCPRGLKIVKRKGLKIMVPDVEYIRTCWHIQHMKSHGMSLKAISDYLEGIDAAREGREPLPHKRDYRTKSQRKKARKRNKDIRRWHRTAVWNAINDWPRVKEIRRLTFEPGRETLGIR